MPQHECSVCNYAFEEKYFDTEQNKCILHCEKNEDNDWYSVSDTEQKKWNMVKIRIFWAYIQTELDDIYQASLTDEGFNSQTYIYNKVIFPKFEKEPRYNPYANNQDEMGTNFYSFGTYRDDTYQPIQQVNTFIEKLSVEFDRCTFLESANFRKYNFEKSLRFTSCIFKNPLLLKKVRREPDCEISFLACDFNNFDLLLNYGKFHKKVEVKNCKNINNIKLKESTFNSKVKIQSCDIQGKADFYNTKFNDLADFSQTVFNETIFERIDFNDSTIFSETKFNKNVDFKYTKFLGISIFKNAIFNKKLNLEDAIFIGEANFLYITFKKDSIQNRETARILKSIHDKGNNIIEANKFYALEMEERKNELKPTENLSEWLIFKLHGLSSNHSQDWVLALLWIVNFVLIYAFIRIYGDSSYDLILVSLIMFGMMFSVLESEIRKVLLFIMSGAIIYHDNVTVQTFTDTVKEVFKFGNDFTLLTFGFRMAIAYLIYQFIISVRQNTRRK